MHTVDLSQISAYVINQLACLSLNTNVPIQILIVFSFLE